MPKKTDIFNIPRYYKELEEFCRPGKVLILYGPRQVGKTTLLKQYLDRTPYRYKLDSGDNIFTQQTLGGADFKTLFTYADGYELLAIDEAQNIPEIGKTLKIWVDQLPHLRIIVTGSSAFELAGQVGEPLVGRQTTLTLYPIAQLELRTCFTPIELREQLEDYLIYGTYPAVLQQKQRIQKQDTILELAGAYLLKDILTLDKIKSSKVLVDLLRLLAFQIGSEVSYTELAQKLMIDAKTIVRYLDILEKSFVIYQLRGFSKNLRKEMSRKSKYYFYDLGIRNALIANFNILSMRDDVGKLWENFLMMERLKRNSYRRMPVNYYFWRTWDKKEIDLIEEREGHLFGFEFTWKTQQVKAPTEWLEAYPKSTFTTIHPKNYLEWLE